MSNNLLSGKRGIITGALDENSIAWKVALKAHEQGAKIILIASRNNQEVKIALASNFKIAEIDIFRLKNLHKDLIIKSII